MTTPDPASPPDPVFDKWAARARQRILQAVMSPSPANIERVVTELVRDGQEYAAARVEQYARPDDRWGPE
jgi:hypothetical protein